VGFLFDAGVPDGAQLALALRPAPWLRLYAGGGHNSVSKGFRGGFSVVPFAAGPAISLEAGHFFEGDANKLIRKFDNRNIWLAPLFRRLSYTYANLHAGLDFGRGAVTFFMHGGFSYVRTTIHKANEVLDDSEIGAIDNTTITLPADPVVKILTPSVKLGMVIYFN
jgi:hypothetical protein